MSDPSPLRRMVAATFAASAIAVGCANGLVPAPADVSDPAAGCQVETPPGPGDRVPEAGEMDVSDIGSGRLRLCLTQPAAIEVEGSAWCTWNEARTVVNEVAGLPVNLGPDATIDAGISIERKEAYLSSNQRTMVGSWQGGPVPIDVLGSRESGDVRGSASFVIPQVVDPEHPPAVRPPDAAGTLGWQCGDPPPPG